MPGCSPGPSPQQMYCNQSKPLSQNHRFDEKLAVLWCFFHCRTFHSASVVNCTENGPLPVSSRSRVNMFGKEADTMRMLRSEDQNRGFDEKLAVLWCFFTAVHFIQVVVQKHTRNCQLDEQSQHVWQGCRYHADVQSKAAYRQNSDQLWYEAKTKLPSDADFTRRGWNIEFWPGVFKPYDIPLNNQQCFDFVSWSSAQSFRLVDGVLTMNPDYST